MIGLGLGGLFTMGLVVKKISKNTENNNKTITTNQTN